MDFIFSSPYVIAASILLVLSLSGLTLIAAKYYIHMLQLEGYFLSQYAVHLFARLRKPSLLFHPQPAKKPLKFTARIVRLYICLALVTLLISALCVFFSAGTAVSFVHSAAAAGFRAGLFLRAFMYAG